MEEKIQLQSDVHFNKIFLNYIDEFVNIIFNDCLDIYGRFDDIMFADLKCIYENKINDHFNNIYDSYSKIYKKS